ncbi:glycosyltransferase family 2 protein [Stenotrophomonas indicatrix]|uniref:glycosyltransferase family 2 protein n=1 Tax=Stenotrophomonas indicatrix TaxID=2045451 RepID=UPI0028A90022|nr:glycosyltransferase family 2 protein [Stenotrophomonas indicatrix]
MWVAGGSDPQFLLDHPAFPLQPGWYRVQAVFAEIDGRLERPCLYPDFGEGISEATRMDLFPDLGRGQLDQLVHVSAPLISLRFDPSTCPARFRLHALTLTPVQPLEARWLAMDALLAPQLEFDPALAESTAVWGYGNAPDVPHIDSVLARTPLAREMGQSAYTLWCDREDRLLDVLAAGSGHVAAAGMPWLTLLVEDPADAFTEASLLRFDAAAVQVIRMGGRALAACLEQAQGQWIGCLRSGDRLHRHLPSLLAQVAQHFPAVPVAYTDEDVALADGGRAQPWRKPAFDRLRFFEQDYLGHSAFVRRQALSPEVLRVAAQSGWFGVLVELSSSTEREDLPVHIPHVLRHVAAASGPNCAPMMAAGQGATEMAGVWQRFFDSRRCLHRVEATAGGNLRYVPHVSTWPSVDIIIPTRDRVDLLRMCLSTLLERTDYPGFHVHVVDNGSVELETLSYLDVIGRDARVSVHPYDLPFNYSAINNFAVAKGCAEVVVLLNNDIEITDVSWLKTMVALAVQPEVGAVGAKLFYPDGHLQHAGVLLGIGGVAAHAFPHAAPGTRAEYGRAAVLQQYSAVTAACLAVRRQVFDAVSGLDESLAVAFNDVDFCLRIGAAGWTNAWTPHAVAVHHESASRGSEDNPEKQARFAAEVATMRSRWLETLESDPAYSPGASLSAPGFGTDPLRQTQLFARAASAAPPVLSLLV